MQAQANQRPPGLQKGQLWKVEHSYIYIVDLGKRLIHYKLLKRPAQVAAITRMIGIEALTSFLRQHDAQLVC